MATLTATGGGKTITISLLSGYSFPEALSGSFNARFRCWFIDAEGTQLLRVEHDGMRCDLAGVDWVNSTSDDNDIIDSGTMTQ